MKSIIFKTAWACFKDEKCTLSFASCLKNAWYAYKLRQRMIGGEVVTFTYTKDDGDMREAVASIDASKSQGKSHSLKTLVYFDNEKGAIRSCRIDRIW